jgi:uncharacterized protein YcfL
MKRMLVLAFASVFLLFSCKTKVSEELNKKLLLEHKVLVQEQGIMADEHNSFESEVKAMEEEYFQTVETPDSLYTYDLENHKKLVKNHGILTEQHQAVLKAHTAIVEKHASQKIMDDVFRQEHEQLMKKHDTMKAEHDRIHKEHEEFEKQHRVIIDNYPTEKRKKKQ